MKVMENGSIIAVGNAAKTLATVAAYEPNLKKKLLSFPLRSPEGLQAERCSQSAARKYSRLLMSTLTIALSKSCGAVCLS